VNEGVGVFEGAFDWEGEGASDVGAEEGVDVGFVVGVAAVGDIEGSTVAVAVGLKGGS
jgi:hypothetical protein